MSALPALAQSPVPAVAPGSPDNIANQPGIPFTTVMHTGTDALVYDNQNDPSDPHNGETMQLMTWDDNGTVVLSWSFFQNSGPNFPNDAGTTGSQSIIGTGTLSDPDVVMACDQSSNDLYANLVYINGAQTTYAVYVWDASALSFTYVSATPVGHGAPFIHSFPNIDANALGVVALTWQESVNDVVTVQVSSAGNYFLPYPFTQSVSYGRSLVIGSTITGTIRACYINLGINGVPIVNPPAGLFEQILHPDVAISEGDEDNAIISSSYIRHFVDGANLFTIVNRLTVKQTRFKQFSLAPDGFTHVLTQFDLHDWAYSNNDVLGTPRIAASAGLFYGQNVEVVVDRKLTGCAGAAPSYEIRSYGKTYNSWSGTVGTIRPADYISLSPPASPNLSESIEPAVAFHPQGYYILTWTGAGSGYSGSDEDIWAVTLKDGTFISPPYTYSRVNDNLNGDQSASSVAGRHLGTNVGFANGGSVHLFVNEDLQDLRYRRSKVPAGTTAALKPGGPRTGTGNQPGSDSRLLHIFPNPSDGPVSLQLNLRSGEELKRLTVVDLTGRIISELPISGDQSQLSWKPAAQLPAGSYLLKAITSERTESTVINRK